MSNFPGELIVAGVDGSAASASAARWAADEAQLRNKGLGLLFTYQIPVVGHPEYEYPPEFVQSLSAVSWLPDFVFALT